MSWIFLIVAALAGAWRAPWYAPAAISVMGAIYALISAHSVYSWRLEAGLGTSQLVYLISPIGAIAMIFAAWAIGRGFARLFRSAA